MKIQIRADSVVIEGYVNAVERPSKPLISRFGQFIEKICAGAFGRAIKRNDNIRILLNHNPERDLGGTGTGELELTEDAIGLHARAVITDADVIKDARNNNLVGWSFGFMDRAVDIMQDNETGLPLRAVRDLDLEEVSLLNREKTPAYNGTLVNVRDDKQTLLGAENIAENVETVEDAVAQADAVAQEVTDEIKTELRAEDIAQGSIARDNEPEVINTDTKSFDNSKYKNIVAELKAIRDSVKK